MDDRIILLLSKATNKLKNYLIKESQAHGVKISSGQSGVLFLLQQNNCQKMTELGKALETDNSAITRIIDKLEEAGLVERGMNEKDRRQYLISITDQGDKEANKMKMIAVKTNQKIKEGFTEEEIDIFKRVLNSFFYKFDN
ncbi:MarR family transcriptional regulator [bacterium]|nr:MarR family transcriptional regulator [bacterium]